MSHQLRCGLLACSLASLALAQPDRPFQGHQVHRVTVRDQRQLTTVTNLADVVWSCSWGIGPIDIQLSPDKVAPFLEWAAAQGVEDKLLIPDVQALVDAEQAQIQAARRQRNVEWFNTYHDLTEIHARLDELAAAYPQFATTFVAGRSLQGRDIKGIRFSAPDQPGNPRSQRPQVMFEGLQHAREWIGPTVNMWIADRMLELYATDARIQSIVDHVEVIVVPVINADGYAYTWASPANRMWRKNRRDNGDGTFGVDLNRNWGYQWGGEGTSPSGSSDIYRGTAGFSEPETQVMRDFISAQPRLKAHIDFHSYAQLVLSPWGYTSGLCVDEPLFARLDAMMVSDIYPFHQTVYRGGPSYTTIYPAAGVVPDWVYGDRGVLAWTIELRDTGQYGFVLPAEQIIPTCEETFAAVLHLSEFVQTPLWITLPDAAPTSLDAETPFPIRVMVKSGRDTLDPSTVTVSTRTDPSEPFTANPMVLESGSTFIGALPASPCGRVLEYRFTARTTAGETVSFPDQPLSVPVTDSIVLWSDSVETDRGWSAADPTDTATLGRWQRADPEATDAQPENDVSNPGTLCWVTGAARNGSTGANDVDGGTTTLTSPVFSALPPAHTNIIETRVNYWRWYSNNAGSAPNTDSMPIQLSRDGGATWTTLEDVTENAGAWVRKSFRIDDVGAPTAQMRLRFIARDLGSGSVVEAAIDEVSVELLGCTRSGDINRDGGVDGADVEAFFLAWEAGQRLGDFNDDGGVDGADVEEFFLVWELG